MKLYKTVLEFLRVRLNRYGLEACFFLLFLVLISGAAKPSFSQNETLPGNTDNTVIDAPSPQQPVVPPAKPKPRPAYIPDASEWKHDDDETLTPSDLDKNTEMFLLAP